MVRLASYNLAVILFVLATACHKKGKNDPVNTTPVACFNLSGNHYKKAQNVHFNNCSSNFDRLEWYFGDGLGGSVFPEPDYKYNLPGTYTVNLKAFNGTNVAEASSKLWIADTIRVNYSLYWESTNIFRVEMIRVDILYEKDGENNFKYDRSLYFFGDDYATKQSGKIDVVDPTGSLRLKLVTSLYTYTASTALPTGLKGKDSLITSVFDGFDGPKEPQVTSSLSMGKLAQQYSQSYR